MDDLTIRQIKLSIQEVVEAITSIENLLVQYLLIGIVCTIIVRVLNSMGNLNGESMVKEDHRTGLFWLSIIAWPVVLPVWIGALILYRYLK